MSMLESDEILVDLQRSYQHALEQDVTPLRHLFGALDSRQTLFVASGGGLAVARLAAELRMASSAELAQALTPLDLVGAPTLRRAGVVLISARAAHPDVGFALQASRTRHQYPVALVTHRQPASLDSKVFRHLSDVAHIPLATPDGFLASHSVLTLTTAFSRAFGWEDLPSDLPWLSGSPPAPLQTSHCVVLYGPGYASVAVDLETRLSELGLSAVQVVDYRNFGHGRHTGFARKLQDTTVLALIGPGFAQLAERTLREFPPTTRITVLRTPLLGPRGIIDLMAGSIRLAATTALAYDINPDSPGVPKFGRKLYRLSGRGHVEAPKHGAVERKLVALGSPASESLQALATESFAEWRTELQSEIFGALALDYDGTVCATEHRYDLPIEKIQDRLLDVLEGGYYIGFASGRGASLHRDLRKWVPSSFWGQIRLALHNGSWVVRLDQSVDEPTHPSDDLYALTRRIERSPLGPHIELRMRPTQLTIEAFAHYPFHRAAVARHISELAAQFPVLAVKVVRSGHGIDVLDAATSKTTILQSLGEVCEGQILAIGDQGEAGGNDFELLAATRWSISVDRCSGDLTRCWNPAPSGKHGPEALLSTLRGLRRTREGLRLRVQEA